MPIHSQLLPIFLPFFERQTDKKLFPLSQTEGSPLVSRWFRDLLRRIKIKRPAVSLHSLRHSMIVNLEQAKVQPSTVAKLLGHAIGGRGVEGTTYLQSLTYSVKELHEAVEAVTFPIPEPRPALAPEGSEAMPS